MLFEIFQRIGLLREGIYCLFGQAVSCTMSVCLIAIAARYLRDCETSNSPRRFLGLCKAGVLEWLLGVNIARVTRFPFHCLIETRRASVLFNVEGWPWGFGRSTVTAS